jgi:hypothetical protein
MMLAARHRSRPSAPPSRLLARLLTEIFAPAIVAGVLLLIVAWHSAASLGDALRWGLISMLCAAGVPTAGIKGAVTQVDPASGQVLATIPLDKPPSGMAVGNGAVWVANEYGTLTRIDPRAHTLTTFDVGHPLHGVALGDGVIWVSTVAPDGLLRLALPS